MMIRSVCLAVLAAFVQSVSATVITDTFDTTHDYDASGVSGTIWDGFFYNVAGGDAIVNAADANSSNSGLLTFRSQLGNWENADDDGMLLYRTVEGDFDARVKIVSMNNVDWHDAGIMARVADLADAGAGEDWVAVKRFPHGNSCGHRSTDNGSSSTALVGVLQPWLRLVRSGNTIISYRSSDGVNWTQISASARSDMDGLALQVGIWQATFSSNEGYAQFDDFSLRTSISWNSISDGSWTVNSNWTNGVPAGAGDQLSFPGILQGDDVSVTLDGDKVAGSMTFATANSSTYSIDAGTGSGSLTINDNIGVDGIAPFIAVNSGAHSINVPIILSNGVTVTTAWNSELTLRNGISGSGGLLKNGVGTLTVIGTNATYSGDTKIDEGTLNCQTLPEGIQASYMFENSGNLGKDSSVNGNDLTTGSGSPAYSADGKFGGALYLDGSSTLVRSVFPTGVPTGSTPYTIALWEKDDGSTSKGGFLGWGNNAANQCNNLRLDGNSRLINYWYGNDWIITGITPDPKDGHWHHIAITWDGSTQTLYLDGSYVTSIARTGLNAQPANFVIGRTTADANFKGWLDNVQVANRALSAQEISDLAQSGGLENPLPVDTSLQVAEGAMVDLNGSSQTLAGLSGDGRVTSSSIAPVDLTVDSDSAQDFSGGIDGEIALTKVGSGSLTLSGINAYNGGTTVSAGTLVMSMPLLQDVLSESKMWFDAADADTITTNASGVVTLWDNKGTAGSTLDAIPVTAGAGFTVLADELNGNPVLALDGTNGMYTGANTDIAGAQDRTLFVVGCRKNNGAMYFAHTGSGNNGLAFGIASEDNFLFNYIWGDDIQFPARANDVYEIYDYMIENYQSSANLISGETTLSGSNEITPNTDNTPLSIGSRFGGVGNGNIAEVIFFDRALSQGERAGIEAYLRAKWFTGGSEDVLSAGTVSVASGAVLDLDGTTQTLTELSGTGSVSDGTLNVLNFIAPGGVDSVGTLNASSLAISGGTLLVDVTPAGTSDLLQVQGSLDVTGITLQIADLDQLKSGTRYVIATCTPGSLSGTFETTNLSKGWQVNYNNTTGEVCLVNKGLIILIQ